ncbi:MAG: hypothetical protein H7287_09235 [Thermoleophilia bacterium]|nr:hypothetical protein [Thermoleophilia bacterium]
MLPSEEQHETQGLLAAGDLLTGDLGLVALRGMLENGVGYIVSSWQERPTPIDAAIDDARSSVLARHGVVLRRLRALSGLAPLVTSPEAPWAQSGDVHVAPRGLVIFAGRRGLRPALEQFVQLATPGAVVGITYDVDAARMQGALVLDPEPTAAGLMRAFDQAFATSARTGRPTLILVRERLLGMRGTIRCRADVSPRDAAERDAGMPRPMAPELAAATCGLVTAERGPGAVRTQDVVVTVGSLAGAVRRGLAYVDAALEAAGLGRMADDVALLAVDAAGVVPAGAAVDELLGAAPRVLLIDRPGHQLAASLRTCAPGAAHERAALDAETARGEDVAASIARWLLTREQVSAGAAAVLQAIADRADDESVSVRSVKARIPKRTARLNRAVSPTVAAGLALAQGVIGVPARVTPDYPTYQADTGVPLTVVPSAIFVEFGLASGAPNSLPGVFVVTGSPSGVAEQAGASGATVELVDGGSPRRIGQAIATACAGPRVAPHVILIGEVQRVAAPRAATLGLDPELLGTDRIATAAVPASGSVLVDLDDELLAGPVEILLDSSETIAVLDQVRELSPATWDLTLQRRGGQSRWSDAMWNLRRRCIRSISGVDL